MNLLFKITDEDVGEKIYPMNNPDTRNAVRVILTNDSGQIALLNKQKKNEFKLIGGGVDDGETLIDALKREVLEESGCEITDISEIGFVEECHTKNNFVQTSFIFNAKVLHDTHVLNLTDNEIAEGSTLCWFEPHEALNKINDCYKNLQPSEYSNIFATKMINRRDYAILKYYLDNIK